MIHDLRCVFAMKLLNWALSVLPFPEKVRLADVLFAYFDGEAELLAREIEDEEKAATK